MTRLDTDSIRDSDKWNTPDRIKELPICDGNIKPKDIILTKCGEVMIVKKVNEQKNEINVFARDDCMSYKKRPYREDDIIFIIGKANGI